MAVYHCNRHDIDYSGGDCPRCWAEELANEQNEWAAIQSETAAIQSKLMVQSAEKAINPGDYNCPHCRFKTLKRRASRCPKCQGTIDEGHWTSIERWEKMEREAAAKEWAAGAKDRENKKIKERADDFFKLGMVLWVPMLILITGLFCNALTTGSLAQVRVGAVIKAIVVGLIPILNWLIVGGSIYENAAPAIIPCAIVIVGIHFIIYLMLLAKEK